jgi:hypothetical protein
MADKIVIGELDIDVTASVQESKKLKEEIITLKDRLKELKETQGETSDEYIKSSAQLKCLQKELKSHELIYNKINYVKLTVDNLKLMSKSLIYEFT